MGKDLLAGNTTRVSNFVASRSFFIPFLRYFFLRFYFLLSFVKTKAVTVCHTAKPLRQLTSEISFHFFPCSRSLFQEKKNPRCTYSNSFCLLLQIVRGNYGIYVGKDREREKRENVNCRVLLYFLLVSQLLLLAIRTELLYVATQCLLLEIHKCKHCFVFIDLCIFKKNQIII